MKIILEGEWHPNWTEVRVEKVVVDFVPIAVADPTVWDPALALPKRIHYEKNLKVVGNLDSK